MKEKSRRMISGTFLQVFVQTDVLSNVQNRFCVTYINMDNID